MSQEISLILDRSIFHGKLFVQISQKLRELKSRGVISIYISPMLLEETLSLMFNTWKLQELREHLQFILEISDNQWFEDNFEIFKSELGIMPLRKNYQFLKPRKEQILKENIQMLIDGGEPTPKTYRCTKRYKDDNYRKGQNMRKAGYDMRLDVSSILKEGGKKRKDIAETWEDFRDSGLEKFGKGLIKTKQFHTRFFRWVAIRRWIKNRESCPYFTDWIIGILYMQYYSMRYPDEPIDKNAQSDIQHLLYLRDCDAIVSEDQRFMRKAWEDLYKPKGKWFFSINDLLSDRISKPSSISSKASLKEKE